MCWQPPPRCHERPSKDKYFFSEIYNKKHKIKNHWPAQVWCTVFMDESRGKDRKCMEKGKSILVNLSKKTFKKRFRAHRHRYHVCVWGGCLYAYECEFIRNTGENRWLRARALPPCVHAGVNVQSHTGPMNTSSPDKQRLGQPANYSHFAGTRKILETPTGH